MNLRFPKSLFYLLPVDLAFSALLVYFAGYGLCVKPLELYTVEHHAAARLHVVAYRWESPTLNTFFAPANRLDRAVRPAYWQCRAATAPRALDDRLAAMALCVPAEPRE